ncbi:MULTISPECIES: ABC transporter ATP-binding protein [unclassified Bradyrhizobium]|uniref:ABC transporter ATP-binding protein n=1 Tax=unclassified Bradyrhizobium TaxID=2631580 RepID=UPI00244A58D4|nr:MULTISPECIES: ABC transporter ATP-binding protein [unclassified Bradyrhizobium]MDH2344056.1 ABC transporter ATP-binding protein [Bradyrhizobium sp. SSUT77]MDH2350351.1 ABC transporter ATP-binding protein [Bradyrhizobium sp. SSUT112]
MSASIHSLSPSQTRPAPAVSLNGVTRRFSDRTVLDVVSLDLAPGEFVALIGKSGSGKSTLLRAIAGLDDDVDGDGAISVPDDRSVLFQDSRLLPWKTVLQNVVLGFRAADADKRGRKALADVGLAGREDSWPNALSGGEQQRVALARSLVRSPHLLLADEPFGALDALTRLKMHELLFQLIRQQRPTVLLVTHDVDEAIKLADRILVMENGRIAVDGPIALPHPRARDHRFDDLRNALLAALGVIDTV